MSNRLEKAFPMEASQLADQVQPLPGDRLAWRCDPALFDFETTADAPDVAEIVGQPTAVKAVTFGVEMRQQGYNIFVLGPPGIGKRSLVELCVGKAAASGTVPADWCYVNNFDNPRRPLAISMPAGRGIKLRNDVRTLTEDLAGAIPAALESEEHRARVQAAEREAIEGYNQGVQQFADKALSQQIQLIRTPAGFALAPMRDGQVLSPDEFEKLTPADKQQIEQKVSKLQDELQSVIEKLPPLRKEIRDKIKGLHREAIALAMGHLLNQIKERYADLPEVVKYFDAVEADILERVEEWQPTEEEGGLPQEHRNFSDYEINLVVDHSNTKGAPIVYEDHPSYQNLLGRVEHQPEMGALLTNFMLIKPGALHRANGGYLVIDAQRLFQQPYAWEGLKRALIARSIRIESMGEMLSLISTVSLDPEPIPFDVKVLLLGDRILYYLLFALDPDFPDLFKVNVDFEEDMQRTPDNCRRFAQIVAMVARREGHRPLNRAAVARLVEHASRLADDSEKLSTHMRSIADVLREANYAAGTQRAAVIDAKDVQTAIDAQIERSDRVRKRSIEDIARGTVLIATAGTRVAQVNGLAAIDLANFRFGHPVRITATARLGRGEVTDIEREVKLGGALHSKGVLILSSFLAARYAKDQPLSLSASLVFEQSYGAVEGDSASLAELCALLSAIGDLPMRQDLALTGSVNQFGEVQPIGAVNEKIEGFFDVCRARELTGTQGVLIPAASVKNVMLRRDVVEAAEAGIFHVFAVETVDQAMSLLTGLSCGERDSAGAYPSGSFNQRIETRLQEWTKLRGTFGAEAIDAKKAVGLHE